MSHVACLLVHVLHSLQVHGRPVDRGEDRSNPLYKKTLTGSTYNALSESVHLLACAVSACEHAGMYHVRI